MSRSNYAESCGAELGLALQPMGQLVPHQAFAVELR